MKGDTVCMNPSTQCHPGRRGVLVTDGVSLHNVSKRLHMYRPLSELIGIVCSMGRMTLDVIGHTCFATDAGHTLKTYSMAEA